MRIIELPNYVRSPDKQAEMDAIVAEIKRSCTLRPRLVCPPDMSPDEFIFSLQAKSTQATLKMTDQELEEYRNRPLPENWKARPDATTIEEAIGQRDLAPDEISHIEAIRRRPKNSIGQSEGKSASDQRKAFAVESFIFTPPAVVTKKDVQRRAVNLVQYKSEPLKEVWVQIPWYKALWHWATGNEIRSEDQKTKRPY